MKLINIIDSKNPQRFTFSHNHQAITDEVDRAMQAVAFILGVMEDAVKDEDLTDEEFNQLEYIRIALSQNRDEVIEKANYYAREVNKLLSEKS